MKELHNKRGRKSFLIVSNFRLSFLGKYGYYMDYCILRWFIWRQKNRRGGDQKRGIKEWNMFQKDAERKKEKFWSET